MKTALLFGSSGLIGSNLLDNLINNNNYNKIKIFVRGLPSINNSKVEVIKTDFLDLETLKENLIGDDCFFCIGTTHKDTPDKNEYRRIEYDLPVHLAKIAKLNSINNFIYVSSIGANPKASSTYLKNKGQAEEELKKIGFSNLSIIQPSFLVGNRKAFRISEALGIPVMKFLSLFFLGGFKKYTPINVEIVVKAMIKIASENYNEQTYLSDRLQELGSE
ncbi:NAD(P)H-binding protein [Pelagibacterales bacterium SAG-MED17]|jgi:uncharacterized protein YbjT (DUF2867 family)|nr:NAD(P)H-binding protein [Pelagibacterales bacterium SAG-MED17]|tara:strand:- start:168 stop:824 length:657 start_codon:yes stop_codon:yes gene_type:complete